MKPKVINQHLDELAKRYSNAYVNSYRTVCRVIFRLAFATTSTTATRRISFLPGPRTVAADSSPRMSSAS